MRNPNQIRRPNLAGRRASRGISIIEMLAASALFAALALVTLPFLSRLADVRADVGDHEYAIRELRNALEERLGNRHEGVDLDEEPFGQLRQPKVGTHVEPLEDGSERVSVSLSWLNSAGRRVRPIELSYWRFPEGQR